MISLPFWGLISIETVPFRMRPKAWAFVAGLLLLALPATADDRFWIGNGNWNATANWSLSSGGVGGATVPGTSDRAVFDANSTNCTVNQNVDCGGLILSNWTGAITVGDAYTVQIRSSFYQDSGTLTCGTNLFTFYNNNCVFTGGTFTAHTAGWVRFHNAAGSGGYTITGNPTLENVRFLASGGGGTYPWIIPAGSTVTVNRALLLEGSGGGFNSLNTGTLVAKGSVTNYNGVASASSTIILSGTDNQTLHGNAFLPHLIIDKPSGVLTLSGTNKTSRNWTHLAGDINPGVSTVILYPHNSYASGITSTTGRATFYNLSFDQYVGGGPNYYYDLRGDLTLVVSNTLSFGLANIYNAGTLRYGSIEAMSNILVNVHYGNSSTLLKIKGTGAQTLTGAKASDEASPPPVIIDKPSGALTLAGTFSLYNKWTHLAGDVDPGTSYVWMFAYNNARTALTSAVGRVDFYDVRMDQVEGGGSSYYIDIADNTRLSVSNRLMFDPSTGFQIRKGRIEVQGDISNACTSVLGTTLLSASGARDHSIMTFSPYSQLALDMEVDKSGGAFTLATPLVFGTANKDLTVKAGTLNLSTNYLSLTANGADFRMTNDTAVLMTTVDTVTNGMISVTGNGLARIDGDLFVTVADHHTPDQNRTNVIVMATSGPVQNTPFLRTLSPGKFRYQIAYNSWGNRIHITGLTFKSSGILIGIQ